MKWKTLAVRIAIPLVGGMVSSYVANRMNDEEEETRAQYAQLKQPPGSPPGVVFPIVWTGLYTTMGIAHHIVKESKRNTQKESEAFYVQLGLNWVWSYLFFGLRLRGVALIECFALLGAVVVTTIRFGRTQTTAGMLMLPYVAWTAFATYLNAGTWYLNDSAHSETDSALR